MSRSEENNNTWSEDYMEWDWHCRLNISELNEVVVEALQIDTESRFQEISSVTNVRDSKSQRVHTCNWNLRKRREGRSKKV